MLLYLIAINVIIVFVPIRYLLGELTLEVKMSKDGRSLGTRVGSCFENGDGDEGWDAKLIYWVIMIFLFILSGGIILVAAIPWMIWRAKNKLLKPKVVKDSSSSDADAS